MQTTATPRNTVRARREHVRPREDGVSGHDLPVGVLVAGDVIVRHRAPALGHRRAAPRLALLRTVGGWALCDAHDRPVHEAEGAHARRECLVRAVELGAVCLRGGDEMCHRPRELKRSTR